MAQIRIRSREPVGVKGPHGEGDGMLGKGVVLRVTVRLRVQEALALL